MRTMSEESTGNLSDQRSFEERVFARFDAMDSRFNGMDSGFEAIDSRFNSIDGRLERIEARVEVLEVRADNRDRETKPMWERALEEILQVKDAVMELTRKVDVLSRDLLTVRADQIRLDSRLDRIEAKQ